MDKNLPVLLLKKLSLLPFQEVRLELSNELSQKIINLANREYDKKVVVILPNNLMEESPTVSDLPLVGVLALIKSCVILPNKNYRIILKGLNRVKINNYANHKKDKNVLIANIKRVYIEKEEDSINLALRKKVTSLITRYVELASDVSNTIISKLNNAKNLDEVTDLALNFMRFPLDKTINYMNEFNETIRAKMLIKDISIELEVLELNNKIDNEIRQTMEDEQKEFLIKTKIQKLNEELGVKSTKDEEANDYKLKIDSLKINDKTRKKLYNELKKYEYTPSNNPELSVIRTYLDTVLSLPFGVSSKEENKEEKIESVLNKSHYKLDNVKRRIIEYALLKMRNKNLDNPIICLIGPPGVGKSTIAKSIALSLKREFYKISVGGLNDSSELIGHKRTYLGASPGKIIDAIIKCGTNNPVILIDEVDKMVKDYKGDPASTLLDILDSNQNKDFIDNYIEEPFDLSSVLFILTANDYDEIPPVLKDRLEILNIPAYTIFDKQNIARDYLIPNICNKYNVKDIFITDEEILDLIKGYTKEPGLRELERYLDNVIRFMIIHNISSLPNFEEILGKKLYTYELKENIVGEVNLIGVTSTSGAIIKVSSIVVPLMYDSNITGNIGDTLRDSIKVVISYLKSNNYMDYKKSTNGIHINFNTNKFKLDGTSGSLGVAVSLCSLFNNKKVDSSFAFLGDLDLYGRVNKVARIKDKIITAYNNGIKTIFIPMENKIDESDIPKEILSNINIFYVSIFEEVYKLLFKK